ncbi:MAG: hypothetical protein A2V70_12980 [Planctomycetes bacterium RBG_13_63_9]|nr:MAG: hypothetical protein A2V70_12980 [Planctomycetes bacterium RBG_13_63_9]
MSAWIETTIRSLAVASTLVVLTVMPATCIADDDTKPPWRVGLANVQITPEEPIHMAGYASRKKPSEGVLADLYAKAMAIEDAAGQRAVLITADVIGFRVLLAETICHDITDKTGLKRHEILLCPSHTHTGPMMGMIDPVRYGLPPDGLARVHAYTKRLQRQIVDLAVRALADLKPAKLSWGIGTSNLVMNRREFTERGVELAVNPRGYADRSVPVLRVESPDGNLRAVVFGCACHNTTLTGEHYELSGDYAGFAQQHVQQEHPGVQAMFMIGCGGDANPYPRGTVEAARQHGRELGTEVCRVLSGELKPVGGPLRVEFDGVEAPLQPVPAREQVEQMAKGPSYIAYNGQRMLEALDNHQPLPTHHRVPVAVWQFGKDLTLVGLSGETVSEYVPLIEKAIGPRRLWIAGYCNDVFGYLPTAKILKEGGYETRGLFNEIGLFSVETEAAVVGKVRQLAQKAGRELPE